MTIVPVDVATAVTFVGLAGLAVRRRDRPGAVVAALLWLALAGIAVALALGHTSAITGKTAAGSVFVGWIVVVPLWGMFVFEYTGRGPGVNKQSIAATVGYVLVTIGASLWGANVHGAIGLVVLVTTSILQTALIGIGLFGVFLLVRSTATYDDLPRRRGVALSVSGLGISLLLFSMNSLGSTEALPWTTTGVLTVVAGAFIVSSVPNGLFSETPGAGPLARSSILEEMSDAVVVVDRDDRLVDANEAAERSLGVVVARDAGRPIHSVLGWEPTTTVSSPATVSTPNGRRQFDGSESSLTNRGGDTIGTAYVFKDVTEDHTREQRLEVLNRVLRHNLRNDLDAIRAFAEALADGDVDDPAAIAERIQRTSSDLVDIGTTVERSERMLTQGTLDAQEVDATALAGDVATRVHERYDCGIDIVSPSSDGSGTRLRTDRTVLRTALLEVVENAAEHTDSEPPPVTITLEATEQGVTVAVRDHGPGIPERERAVVEDGTETPLEHGTGVGLWFVSWAVTRLGGELSFDDVESGSRVLITVPDQGTDPA